MKQTILVFAVVFCGIFAHGQNVPEVLTGASLKKSCEMALNGGQKNPDDYVDTGVCIGEVSATAYVMSVLKIISVPKEVSVEDEIRVVVKFLDANPTEVNLRDTSLVGSALVSVWGTKK
jgi:hypothetical protein